MKHLLLIVILVAACGGKNKPAPAPEPAPTSGPAGTDSGAAGCGDAAPSTAEECECHGWLVVGDIGDGQVKCPDDTREVSRIAYGIEGGVCCDPGKAAE
ncbi:MAG TPA: hypothetical protein VM261_19485 [Kofleriaceae bacterium]|nr:hypothetical protein [Kofleriaceae bacterium]